MSEEPTKEFDPVEYYTENMEIDQAIKMLYDEMQRYKKGYEAAMRIVRSTYPDQFPDTYFICGEGGEKDQNNLPDRIHICPAYGCDWFQVYEKTNVSAGPEY